MGEWKKQGFGGNPLFNIKEKEGQETVGTYQGVRHIEKTDSNIHALILESGEAVDFWGSGQLDYLLKDVPVGAAVKIVYRGQESIKVVVKGKKIAKLVHQFEVFTK